MNIFASSLARFITNHSCLTEGLGLAGRGQGHCEDLDMRGRYKILYIIKRSHVFKSYLGHICERTSGQFEKGINKGLKDRLAGLTGKFFGS